MLNKHRFLLLLGHLFTNERYFKLFISPFMQLLDCFGIPVLMALSWFILYARYRVIHFIAVAVCLLGVGTMVGADILAGREENTGETVLLISGLVTEDILLMSSLLFCKDKVKGREHVLITYLKIFIFRFACFWYYDHFNKAFYVPACPESLLFVTLVCFVS